MRTTVMKGVRPPPFDQHIEAFAKGQTNFPHPTNLQRLAVLNDEGKLYRVIELDSVSTAIALMNSLAAHDVWDRIKVCRQKFDVIDLLTGEPYRGQYDAVLQVGIEAHPLPH